MNYLVSASKNGFVFATMEEAVSFCNHFFRETGIMVSVVQTQRKVTHVMNVEEVRYD